MAQTVGEFLVLGFRGPVVPDWLRHFAERHSLGGVILFDYDVKTRTYENNIRSRAQLVDLCGALHELPGSPLIYIDQEGGKVRRLKEKLGFAPLPSQAELVEMESSAKQEVLENAYREMKEVGIDVCLAPVVDLNTNPRNPDIGAIGRSYSSDPEIVAAHALLVDRAARKSGVGLCLKHYPGLGGATVNSHLELTDLSGTVGPEQLRLFETLAPQIYGQMVLVSHGILKQWEPGMPVSMSAVGLGKLRQAVPSAVLISDDLQMQGLQKIAGTEQACLRALAAGLDLLIVGNNLIDEQDQAENWGRAIELQIRSDGSFQRHCALALERALALKTLLQR